MKRKPPSKLQELRKKVLANCYDFARVFRPERVLAPVHKELLESMANEDIINLLVLIPRGHQKSWCTALYAAWMITKHPDTTILYVSDNQALLKRQLAEIKQTLLSETYRQVFPEMLNYEFNKDRGRMDHKPQGVWTSTEFSVDHPARKKALVRDPTVTGYSAKSTLTGFHADLILVDDLVTEQNYQTEVGREEIIRLNDTLTRLANPDSLYRYVGTTYHPKDLYALLQKKKEPIFDDEGEQIDEKPLFTTIKYSVETNGDFLWPRTKGPDGKWYGWDKTILGRKKAQAMDKVQYAAQYYLDLSSALHNRVDPNNFNYYNPELLKLDAYGRLAYNGKRLNVFAGIDLAFSIGRDADYTAVVVIGADCDNNIFILDIDRFRTDKLDVQVEALIRMANKWSFKLLRIEANGPQKGAAVYIKDQIHNAGRIIDIDLHTPNRQQGSKEERIAAVLEGRYFNKQMWHPKIHRYLEDLETQLVMLRPEHDDIKDVLASTVEVVKLPMRQAVKPRMPKLMYNKKFGGVTGYSYE